MNTHRWKQEEYLRGRFPGWGHFDTTTEPLSTRWSDSSDPLCNTRACEWDDQVEGKVWPVNLSFCLSDSEICRVFFSVSSFMCYLLNKNSHLFLYENQRTLKCNKINYIQNEAIYSQNVCLQMYQKDQFSVIPSENVCIVAQFCAEFRSGRKKSNPEAHRHCVWTWCSPTNYQ